MGANPGARAIHASALPRRTPTPYIVKPLVVLLWTCYASAGSAQDPDAAPQSTPAASAQTDARDANQADRMPSAEEESKASSVSAEETPAAPLPAMGEPEKGAPVVNVVGRRTTNIGPLPGLKLLKEEIPGNLQTITAKQIEKTHAVSLADLMNQTLQSVNVNDYQGNPFQMDVTYRGFTASPQIGTQQGLSVFFDGIRVNEPFGDVVNWDLIPMNAISSMDVIPGSNPLFGLGTLGGALSINTKSGYTTMGASAEILAGSFGRKQLQLSAGNNNEVVAGFVAANLFMEDGWRDNSPSKVNQLFGKGEWRNERTSFALTGLYAWTKLIGNGVLPIEMYRQDPSSVFSSPDETRNRLLQVQLSGAHDVNDNFTITSMVYHRNSKRKAVTGDIYGEFAEMSPAKAFPSRRPRNGELPVCGFQDVNHDGLPDYFVDQLQEDQSSPGNFLPSTFQNDYFNNGVPNFALLAGSLNQALPTAYAQKARTTYAYRNTAADPNLGTNDPPVTWDTDVNGSFVENYTPPMGGGPDLFGSFFLTNDLNNPGFRIMNVIVHLPTITPTCDANLPVSGRDNPLGFYSPTDSNGQNITTLRNGNLDVNTGGTSPGYIDGTPVAVLSKTDITQRTTGGGLQLNWNFDQHKFMVGASVDQARAGFESSRRLGLFDDNRRAYLDPNAIGPEFAAATQDVPENDFSGTSTTWSLYLSETWSPFKSLHLTAAGRYNNTRVRNNLATRRTPDAFNLADYISFYSASELCPSSDPASCPYARMLNPIPVDLSNLLGDKQVDKFTYTSFNPSFGANWQPTETLDLYANWSRGTRTPSVVELGCAFDPTIIIDTAGRPRPRSLALGAACTLPTSLSGDPYLPQVVARTIELGARGNHENYEWNVAAYRTNLHDDIYFTGFTASQSFFTTIGESRRQGIELGGRTRFGKFGLRVNYALTDATFQSSFKLLSPNNSTAVTDPTKADYQQIRVEPGDRIPGVPQHNANITLDYEITPAWKAMLSMVAHSWSYLRGNENNDHQPGPQACKNVRTVDPNTGAETVACVPQPDFQYDGKIPGYAVFNLQTTYALTKDVTVGLQINNLFDRKYYSAGRLGVNPFSPSVNGAIGPSGWNYNSGEWLNTQLIAPGAPRGIWLWVSATLDFRPSPQ